MRTWRLVALSGVAFLGAVFTPPAYAQTPSEIQIAPAQVQLRQGDRTQVFATAYDASGGVILNPAFLWSSSDSNVVRVEADPQAPEIGTLIGVSGGAAVVTARIGSARGFTTVTVTGAPPQQPPGPPVVVAPIIVDSVLAPGVGALALRSIARVDVQRFGTPATCATGVLVGNGLLVTSYQGIRGSDRLTVTPEGGAAVGDAQIAAYNTVNDLAVIRFSGTATDSLPLAGTVADDQYAWAVGFPSCQGVPSTTRLRIASWQDRPTGLLRHTGNIGEASLGAALIDRTGALVGIVTGDRTTATPFTRVQTALIDARDAAFARRLQAPADVARAENHLYGAFLARSDVAGATARVSPLESWQWAGLRREGAVPLTFAGPMGRYQVDLLVGGAVRTSTTVTITPGVLSQVTLGQPTPVAATPTPQQAAPAPAPPQPQPQAKRGGGGAVVPLVLLLAGGGGAAAYFLTKKKADSTGTGGGGGGGGTGSISVNVPNP